MRLRPSGRQGPLATKLSAFADYQRREAATWEHMALTRARVLAGDLAFSTRVRREINAVLRRAPAVALRGDVVAMRALVSREKPATGDWDLKMLPGGLLDIEFVAQYLVLAHAAEVPQIIDPSTQVILTRAVASNLIDGTAGTRLIAAHRLYTNTLQIMRLALGADGSLERAGQGVRHRLAASAGLPSFSGLAGEIAASRQAVREIFRAVLSGG